MESVTTPTSNRTQTPVEKLTLGQVHVTIWRNDAPDGRIYYTTRIERRYTDRDNNWKTSSSFGKAALPVLIDLLSKAKARIDELERQA